MKSFPYPTLTESPPHRRQWRWSLVTACVLLTIAGFYGLMLFTNAPFINLVLFVTLALGCPLAAGLVWWLGYKDVKLSL